VRGRPAKIARSGGAASASAALSAAAATLGVRELTAALQTRANRRLVAQIMREVKSTAVDLASDECISTDDTQEYDSEAQRDREDRSGTFSSGATPKPRGRGRGRGRGGRGRGGRGRGA
jgi:hypothetical protein